MTNSKFAPVCPVHMYKELKEKGPEYFGDYFLLLAHDVVKYSKEYHEVFVDNNDYTIIMDNSVIELGNAVDHAMLVDACCIVDADVLAIPDVLEDGEATIEAAVDFLEDWDPQMMTAGLKLMFIPQGSDIDDYVGCVMRACELNIPMDWIGIARNTTGRIVPSREQLIGFFATLQPDSLLHLLGFSKNVFDDIQCARSPLVQGIDSALPLRTTQKLQYITERLTNDMRRGDWWETGKLEEYQMKNLLLTRNNICPTQGFI